MRKINYSPDSVEKLQKIKVDITEKFGEETALDTIVEMMDTIDLLTENPELGDSVSDMYNIPTEYRRLYVCHNSIIYLKLSGNTPTSTGSGMNRYCTA